MKDNKTELLTDGKDCVHWNSQKHVMITMKISVYHWVWTTCNIHKSKLKYWQNDNWWMIHYLFFTLPAVIIFYINLRKAIIVIFFLNINMGFKRCTMILIYEGMKECFWQNEYLEVFWQQVSFLGYFLDLREFLLFFRGRGGTGFWGRVWCVS